MDMPTLLPGQTCQVWTSGPDGRAPVKRFETSARLLEAPNWASSGDALVLSGDGLLWRLTLSPTPHLDQIVITDIPQINNDHVLDPDGEHIYLSVYPASPVDSFLDWQIYRAPLSGGSAELITTAPVGELLHFLHGVHPRGGRLAFTGMRPGEGNWSAQTDIYTMSVNGDDYRQLTAGPGLSDGGEYAPDGEWIYFNTERFDGHGQIARIRPDGSGLEQLTFDENVNWFPHISPDGRWATYIAFPPGTEGHPPNVWVDIKLVALDDWSAATTVDHLFGGQGTSNTNGWAPDSSAFAYVSYPTSD